MNDELKRLLMRAAKEQRSEDFCSFLEKEKNQPIPLEDRAAVKAFFEAGFMSGVRWALIDREKQK